MNHALLKLTGGAFSGTKAYDNDFVASAAGKIAYLHKRLPGSLAITLGGGNIFRGRDVRHLPHVNKQLADNTGMMATLVNGGRLAIELTSLGLQVVIMNAHGEMPGMEPIDHKRARQLLDVGYIVIFVGGTGRTGVTTDTGVVERAVGCGVQTIWMAKDFAHGVFDSDPRTNPGAKRFSEINITDILTLNLEVMDRDALELALANNIGFVVFNGGRENQWETISDTNTSVEHSIVHAC